MKVNKKEKSEVIREKIVKYSQKGWSQVKIKKHLKCSRCCVQNTLKRFVETGVHKNRKKPDEIASQQNEMTEKLRESPFKIVKKVHQQ